MGRWRGDRHKAEGRQQTQASQPSGWNKGFIQLWRDHSPTKGFSPFSRPLCAHPEIALLLVPPFVVNLLILLSFQLIFKLPWELYEQTTLSQFLFPTIHLQWYHCYLVADASIRLWIALDRAILVSFFGFLELLRGGDQVTSLNGFCRTWNSWNFQNLWHECALFPFSHPEMRFIAFLSRLLKNSALLIAYRSW